MRPRHSSANVDLLKQLYRDYHALIRAVALGRGVPEAAADDVVHDVFVAAHGRLDARDTTVPLRRWLVSVTRNVAFSHRRSAARRTRRLAAIPPTDPVAPISAEELDARRAWQIVSAFVETLPGAQGEVFVLCQVQGLAASEVSRILSVSPNTVSSRLRLARKKFATRFPAASGVADSDELLRAARRGNDKTPAERRHALAALVAELSFRSTAAKAATTAAVTWMSGVAATVAMVVGVATSSTAASEPPREPTALRTTAVESAATPAAKPKVVAEMPEPARPSSAALAPDIVHPSPTIGPTGPKPSSSRTKRRQKGGPVAVPKQPEPRSDLAAETRLLKAARAQLNNGSPHAAATTLRRYEERFPAGALSNERTRLGVSVHCRLGDTIAAARLADAVTGIRQSGASICEQ